MSRMVRVVITPGARKERFEQTGEDVFAIAVREPAEGNLANARVRELLARHFEVPTGAVRIEAGHHAQKKRVRIEMSGV